MREIHVAVVQMAPLLHDVSKNLAAMRQAINEIATAQPVHLIVFPELATTGCECGVGFLELADEVTGEAVAFLAEQAAGLGVYIAFGMAVRHKIGSVLYNAAVLVGPEGKAVGHYAKVHLRGEERLIFREGFRYRPLETEFGPIGLMLGWDLAFPEVARIYALQGVELVCLLANWEAGDLRSWGTLLPARALENGLYIVAANRVGEEPSYRFGGHSAVVGPNGRYLTIIEEDENGLPPAGYAVARLNLDAARREREERGLMQARQPASYREIVKRY